MHQTSNPANEQPAHSRLSARRQVLLLGAVLLVTAVATLVVVFVLITIFEHKQDARTPYLMVAELSEISVDPRPWGLSWPHHFDQYKQTAGDKFVGGSSAMPQSKLEQYPWLKRLFAGYAFSIDYREARGHAYMLYDQMATERVHQRQQTGACLHCHASTTVLYRKAGLEAMGLPSDDEALARDFNMDAVITGFKVLSTEPYHQTLAMLMSMPDGTPFHDYLHGETGARLFKAQHPEFELWSQGVHARSGVSCADCHMPYERRGAMKLSNHNVRSPLENINNACQSCHNVPEQELLDRVRTIQDRTAKLKERAAGAMTDMLDAILEAKASGATEQQLAPVLDLQRKAMWRLDFIVSENSLGFHAPQEAARILGESIDFSRQAQAMALRLRAGQAPDITALPRTAVQGVTQQ